jgi:hypothetical protein
MKSEGPRASQRTSGPAAAACHFLNVKNLATFAFFQKKKTYISNIFHFIYYRQLKKKTGERIKGAN